MSYIHISKGKNADVGVCLAQLKNNEEVGVFGMEWEMGRGRGDDEIMEIMWGLIMPSPVSFYRISAKIISGFQTKNNWSDSSL